MVKKRKKANKDFSKRDIINTIIVPVAVALITVSVAGYFQMKSINVSNKAQIEASIKTANAQIKAAEISKVNKIEYDYKESSNWNVNESGEYMPLKKGNYWLYKGSYTSYSIKYKDYFTKPMKLKFEILDEIKSKDLNISLFIVNNYPTEIIELTNKKFENMDKNELTSLEPIKFIDNHNISGLLLVANKLFYIPGDEIGSVKNYINGPDIIVNQQQKNPTPTLDYDDLLFEFPLFKGQRFGNLETITRSDFSHFWYVNNVREISALVENKFEKVQIFNLIYNTKPDQQIIDFRPYIGILLYKFAHKGSTEDLQLELSKFELK